MTSSQDSSSKAVGEVDYYKLLGVSYTATSAEIARAYRDKMKRAHPDRHRPAKREQAEERAKQLNLAYKTLSNVDSRGNYDIAIKQQAVQSQVMNRYFGGVMAPGQEGIDPLAQAMRRERSEQEKLESVQANRGAFLSIVLAFGGVTLLVFALLLAWALVNTISHSLF